MVAALAVPLVFVACAHGPTVALARTPDRPVTSSEATPTPVPRPPTLVFAPVPLAARSYRAIRVSAGVRSAIPVRVSVQVRRKTRGTVGAWRDLASRTVTGSPSARRIAFSIRLRTRGLQQLRMVAETTRTVVASTPRNIRIVGGRVVALTFDDGPSTRTTPLVLAALRRYDVPATFFILGALANREPALVRRIVAEGHGIGSHSRAHRILPRLSDAALRDDLERAKASLEKAAHRSVHLLLPPYGSTSPRVLAAIRRAGMTQVLWSVDPRDWASHSPGQIVSSVLGHTHDGSIVLMHDSGGQAATTGRAVPRIIARLKARGYDMVTLDEMAALGYRVR
jgi:peptidoglycan/xylan/chitin deacetylase (PgdA/CDA1 family)